MDHPDTLVLNLTFLGTVGVALMMFGVLFLLGSSPWSSRASAAWPPSC